MRHLPRRQVALVAGLLTAFLAAGPAVATSAAAAARDPSPAATRGPHDGRAEDGDKDRDKDQDKDQDRDAPPSAGPSAGPTAGPTEPDHDEQAAPFVGPTAPAKPGKHARKTAKQTAGPVRAHGGSAAQPVPVPVPPVPMAPRPPTGLLTGRAPAPAALHGPFLRTAQPVRPLTRPVAVVRRGPPLWRVHEPVDRPLLQAVRTVAGDPTTPLLVAGLVGLFLLVQHRIDRNDPKLSRGHRNDPPDLRFGPARRLQTAL